MTVSTTRKLAAEAIGAGFLLATVVGSGIMGERLAGGNDALALLGNTLATGAILYVLILTLDPLSGAHFNPAVTLAFLLRREISPPLAGLYIGVQIIAAIIGVWLAHAMFDAPILQASAKARAGGGQLLSEAVATFGLVLTILGAVRFRPENIPAAVGLYITAAYWFTASTSFANPAVTIARTLTDSFAGIRGADAPAFVMVQLAAAALASAAGARLFSPASARAPRAGAHSISK